MAEVHVRNTEQFTEEVRRAEKHIARRDPLLRAIIKKTGPCSIRPHHRHFEILARSIISQQLSTRVADVIGDRLKALNTPARFPTALTITVTDSKLLRAAGLSNQKVSYIKDLAERTATGAIKLGTLKKLTDEQIIEQLVSIKGIGVWTAQMFLIFSLGRLNVLPYGDLGVRKAIAQLYGLEQLPGATEIENIARSNNWYPYCSVASWYLWRSL